MRASPEVRACSILPSSPDLAEEDVQRDFAEEGDAELLGLAPGTAAAEEIDPLVAGGVEEALASRSCWWASGPPRSRR